MSEQQSGVSAEMISPADLTLTDEYQVMDALDDDTFRSIKVSIDTDGFDESKPLTVDEEGVVLDGHHRLKATRQAGIESVPVVRKTGLSPREKRAVAYGQNLRRRNLDDGAKRTLVKRYLEEDFTPDQTQTEAANLLGVSPATVSRARKEIEDETGVDVLSGEAVAYPSREEKRAAIRDHIDAHPDASNRTVSDELGVSKTTVGSVRDEREQTHDRDQQQEQAEEGATADADEPDGQDSEGGQSFSEKMTSTSADVGCGSSSSSPSRSRFRTQADKSGETPKGAGGDPRESMDPARDDDGTVEEIHDMMDAVDANADHSDESGPKQPETPNADVKEDVRDVLVGTTTPLTLPEVVRQVSTASEREVHTALSGLVVDDGSVESSPRDEKVWWFTNDTDDKTNTEAQLQRLSAELGEPIIVSEQVYEDGDVHALEEDP